jgi:hypothetical protein
MARMMDAPVRFGRRGRLFLPLAMVAGVLVVGSPAHACSCVPTDLESWLPEADGAFVGRWVDRAVVGNGFAAVTFEVERVVKGSFGPKAIVRTNEQGSACGLELLGAARMGLLLRKAADGVWESDLCSKVTPSELLAVGGDRPPDPGIAPVSAGWEPVSILAIVGLAIFVATVGLLWLTQRRARSTASA